MSSIKVLHISDLHLQDANYDQNVVLSSFHKDVGNLVEGAGSPDLIVFSGDLVHAGTTIEQFKTAIEKVLLPISDMFGLSEERIVVCPGNHDIDRNVVRKDAFVEAGLKQVLASREAINSFIDENVVMNVRENVASQAFSRLAGFYSGVWGRLAGEGVSVNPFFQTRKFA